MEQLRSVWGSRQWGYFGSKASLIFTELICLSRAKPNGRTALRSSIRLRPALPNRLLAVCTCPRGAVRACRELVARGFSTFRRSTSLIDATQKLRAKTADTHDPIMEAAFMNIPTRRRLFCASCRNRMVSYTRRSSWLRNHRPSDFAQRKGPRCSDMRRGPRINLDVVLRLDLHVVDTTVDLDFDLQQVVPTPKIHCRRCGSGGASHLHH